MIHCKHKNSCPITGRCNFCPNFKDDCNGCHHNILKWEISYPFNRKVFYDTKSIKEFVLTEGILKDTVTIEVWEGETMLEKSNYLTFFED